MPADTASAWTERITLAVVFALPLACWPGLDRPFSTPKLWLLAGLCVVQIATALRSGSVARWFDRLTWPLILWLAGVGVSAAVAPSVSSYALLVAVVPLPLFFAVQSGRVDGARLLRALAWASTVESAIVLLQWLGFDPLRAFGWTADVSGSVRMRVYGTLGNPNFVAAWLSATLPLAIPFGAWRRRRAIALPLQIAALIATGSRVVVPALAAALAVLALGGRRTHPWWLAVLPAAALIIWLSPARPLGETLQGRYYLVRVTGSHLATVPVAGYGPGSFEQRFAGWQLQWLRQRGTAAPDRRFAGPVDHAHNDYLEFWVEYGPAGFVAFLILAGWLIVSASSTPSYPHVAALAGAVSLFVVALVDFPFHRPAEWTLTWILLAASVPQRACTAENRESQRKERADVKDVERGVR